MARELDCAWAAQIRPPLISIEQAQNRHVHAVRLDGIERRDEPLRRTCASASVPRQERLGPLANVQNDCAAFEQYLTVLLKDRYLAERL